MPLLISGTLAFDQIETPRGKREKIIGGSVMYASLVSALVYDNIHVNAIIGKDFEEKQLENLFRKRGIDTDGIERNTEKNSFFWHGKYLEDMNTRETILTQLNVLENYQPILPQHYLNDQYLVLANIDPVLQLSIIKQLKTPPVFIVTDTMNFWIKNQFSAVREIIQKSNLLCINQEEASMISGCENIFLAAKKILSMGTEFLIIKRGETGSVLFALDQKPFILPSYWVPELIDPTGAGDCFMGGLAAACAKKGKMTFQNIKQGMILGTCLASFCVEGFGNTKLLSLNSKNLSDRVQDFIDRTAINIPSTN